MFAKDESGQRWFKLAHIFREETDDVLQVKAKAHMTLWVR
jgi:hypothetical protein